MIPRPKPEWLKRLVFKIDMRRKLSKPKYAQLSPASQMRGPVDYRGLGDGSGGSN